MPVITLVDVLRVQSFIFATNRLIDVVAGSNLVADATSRDLLTHFGHGVRVVTAAGGNAVLEFDDEPQARDWTAAYSRTLIEEFPGLEAAVVHRSIADGEPWLTAYQDAQQRLARRKLALPPDAATPGLSVTAECVETRAVATDRFRRTADVPEVPVSATVARRRKLQHEAGPERWLEHVPNGRPSGWPDGWQLALTRQTDELGRTESELSLVGIVHIDGNSVGGAIREALEAAAPGGNATVRQRFEALSQEIDNAVQDALKAVFEAIVNRLDVRTDAGGQRKPWIWSTRLNKGFRLHSNRDDHVVLPIRPVVAAGDELTFVCDGRIALSAARIALESLRGRATTDGHLPLGACAGIALIKSHAPFARGYDLAERLCRGAKREVERHGLSPGFALDWHVGYATPLESVEAIRGRQYSSVYQGGAGDLTMRPYIVEPGRAHSFNWLDDEVVTGGLMGPGWSGRRNKVKELRTLAREGPDAVRQALDAWRITADVQGLPGGLDPDGFSGRRTWLLDAAELLDLHVSLQ